MPRVLGGSGGVLGGGALLMGEIPPCTPSNGFHSLTFGVLPGENQLCSKLQMKKEFAAQTWQGGYLRNTISWNAKCNFAFAFPAPPRRTACGSSGLAYRGTSPPKRRPPL